MSTIKALARGLRSVNLQSEVPRMLASQKNVAINLNRDQMLNGLTSDGETGTNIKGYKSLDYAIFKNAMNSRPEFGIPDLKLNGDFQGAMKLDVDATEYTLYSTDAKSGELENKYTIYIFGLQGKNRAKWAQAIYDSEFKPYITKKTGLLFR